MIGMNNYFYSFKGGNLYRHNVNETRNNFYGQQSVSRLQSVFNEAPLENKIFKTINLEGDFPWSATLQSDIQNDGLIERTWFEKKEGSFYAFVRNTGTVPAEPSEYALRSANGIGQSATITGTGAAVQVNFGITPTPTEIGSILSIGDYLYYSLSPYTVISLFGNGLNYTATALEVRSSASFAYLDSPATTSSTTYKTQFANGDAGADVQVQTNSSMSSIILIEIAG
jgi:hypothetical protein